MDSSNKIAIPTGWLKLEKPRVIRLPNKKFGVDGQPGQYNTKEEAELAAEKYRR